MSGIGGYGEAPATPSASYATSRDEAVLGETPTAGAEPAAAAGGAPGVWCPSTDAATVLEWVRKLSDEEIDRILFNRTLPPSDAERTALEVERRERTAVEAPARAERDMVDAILRAKVEEGGERAAAPAAPRPGADPALVRALEAELDRMLDPGQDIAKWDDYAFRDEMRWHRLGQGKPLVAKLLALPDTPETARLKAKWLEVAGRFVETHRASGIFSSGRKAMYNSIQLAPLREIMAKVLASDPAGIIDRFDDTDVDPTGKGKFVPLMRAMLDGSNGVPLTEREAGERVRESLGRAVAELAGPLAGLKDAEINPASEERIHKQASLLGYLLGGTQAGYEKAFTDDVARRKEQAELFKSVLDQATGRLPGSAAAVRVVNALIGKAADEAVDAETARAYTAMTSGIKDLQGFYRRAIDADRNYRLNNLILPLYDHVLGQSRGPTR